MLGILYGNPAHTGCLITYKVSSTVNSLVGTSFALKFLSRESGCPPAESLHAPPDYIGAMTGVVRQCGSIATDAWRAWERGPEPRRSCPCLCPWARTGARTGARTASVHSPNTVWRKTRLHWQTSVTTPPRGSYECAPAGPGRISNGILSDTQTPNGAINEPHQCVRMVGMRGIPPARVVPHGRKGMPSGLSPHPDPAPAGVMRIGRGKLA